MISNKLLSEVMGYKCHIMDTKHIHFLHNNRVNDIVYEQGGDLQYNINIHELAHKCKEWAYIQGYVLFSKIRLNSSYASCYFDIMGIHDYEDDFHNDFRAETEPDAIFKACEWILDRNSK